MICCRVPVPFSHCSPLPCLITRQLHVCYISQLLRDSFSVSQQPPIWEPPSHYSMTNILMLIRVLLVISLFSTHCRILLVINIDCLAMQTLNFKFITSIFEQFIFEAQSCKVFQKLNIFAVFHMIELSTT